MLTAELVLVNRIGGRIFLSLLPSRFPRFRFALGRPWWAAVDSNHLPPRYLGLNVDLRGCFEPSGSNVDLCFIGRDS